MASPKKTPKILLTDFFVRKIIICTTKKNSPPHFSLRTKQPKPQIEANIVGIFDLTRFKPFVNLLLVLRLIIYFNIFCCHSYRSRIERRS